MTEAKKPERGKIPEGVRRARQLEEWLREDVDKTQNFDVKIVPIPDSPDLVSVRATSNDKEDLTAFAESLKIKVIYAFGGKFLTAPNLRLNEPRTITTEQRSKSPGEQIDQPDHKVFELLADISFDHVPEPQ